MHSSESHHPEIFLLRIISHFWQATLGSILVHHITETEFLSTDLQDKSAIMLSPPSRRAFLSKSQETRDYLLRVSDLQEAIIALDVASPSFPVNSE